MFLQLFDTVTLDPSFLHLKNVKSASFGILQSAFCASEADKKLSEQEVYLAAFAEDTNPESSLTDLVANMDIGTDKVCFMSQLSAIFITCYIYK